MGAHDRRAWPGGLVVASHDRAFLAAIGVDVVLELGDLRGVVDLGGPSLTLNSVKELVPGAFLAKVAP